MDIKYRITDVQSLRSHICQDFLKMIIKPGWKEMLFSIAKNAVETNTHKEKYIPAYEKMCDYGLDSYQIDDMDVTLINAIVIHNKDIILGIQRETQNTFKRILQQRNTQGHYTDNEKEDILYINAIMDLIELRVFARTVYDKETLIISEKDRSQFRQKYIKQINDLMHLIDKERAKNVLEEEEMDERIHEVQKKNDFHTWRKVLDIYFKEASLIKDFSKYHKFVIRASDAGVSFAHDIAISSLFSENKIDEAVDKSFMILFSEEVLSKQSAHTILECINYYTETSKFTLIEIGLNQPCSL